MKHSSRDLLPWFGMLLLSLGLAYWASLPAGEKASSKISIVSLSESGIGSIEIATDGSKVQISRRSDFSDRWWIAVERKEQAPPLEQGAKVPSNERFMASPKFKEMLAMFAPFQALRVIGDVKDDQLKEFGLSQATKTLTVKDLNGSVALSLTIGSQLYGSRNYYVQNQSDKKVLLVPGDLINDLEKPELRVFERSITSILPEEIQSAVVTSGTKSRTFGHTRRDEKGALVWTGEGGDSAPVPHAASWFEKFTQLKGAVYATEADESAIMAIPVLFEVKINGVGSASDTIQVRKRPGSPTVEYWLTSHYLKWNVKVAVTRAEILEKDLPQLIGNDSAPIR